MTPWYLPRSRGGTTSLMIAIDSTISPPPPMPCSARKEISSIMLCAWPHSAEPIRKIRMQIWKTVLRPNMSPSLPHSGVVAVEASMYAVTTQDRWLAPPRSPTIVGSAVATIVWSRAARNMPSITPANTSMTFRRFSSIGGVSVCSCWAWSTAIRRPPSRRGGSSGTKGSTADEAARGSSERASVRCSIRLSP